jgi:hypothetical protein
MRRALQAHTGTKHVVGCRSARLGSVGVIEINTLRREQFSSGDDPGPRLLRRQRGSLIESREGEFGVHLVQGDVRARPELVNLTDLLQQPKGLTTQPLMPLDHRDLVGSAIVIQRRQALARGRIEDRAGARSQFSPRLDVAATLSSR